MRPTEFLNEWSARDRELAKAKVLNDRNYCPGCGHPKSEVWVDPGDAKYHYIAEEVQCLTCARLQSEQDGAKTQKGLHYFIQRHPLGSGQALPDPDE